MSDSKIVYDKSGDALVFSGPDAVAMFQAAALRSGLGLMAKGIRPHRSWTSLRVALQQATHYTGKPYHGKKDVERARADLQVWVDTMRAALPKEVRS